MLTGTSCKTLFFTSFVGVALLCSAAQQADPKFSESVQDTVRLGKNNRLLVESADKKAEYKAGDLVYVRLVDGIVYVNDIQVIPVPGSDQQKMFKVQTLKRLYGRVPLVQRYVREHGNEGSEEQIWNDAVRFRSRLRESAVDEMAARYWSLVEGSKVTGQAPLSADSASEIAAEILRRETDLVDSVRVGHPPRRPSDLGGYFDVYWKGIAGSEGLQIEAPRKVSDSKVDPQLMPRKSYEGILGTIRLLSSDRSTRVVKLINGTVQYQGGVAPEETKNE